MLNLPTTYGEIATNRFIDELRTHMTERGYSANTLGKKINVSQRTIEGWLAGQRPQFDMFWRLVHLFGPAFLNGVIEPLGMTGVHHTESDDDCPYRLLAELNNTSSAVADAIKDHVITPAEKKNIDRFLTSLSVLAAQFKRKKPGRV